MEPVARQNNASFWNVVFITKSERSEVEPRMPVPLVPFNPDGMGNHWCLNTTLIHDGECPVVFWDHDGSEDQQPRQTHSSFLDWLEDRMAFEEDYRNKEKTEKS